MLLPVLNLKTNGADLNGGAYFCAEGKEREREVTNGVGGGAAGQIFTVESPFFASSCK